MCIEFKFFEPVVASNVNNVHRRATAARKVSLYKAWKIHTNTRDAKSEEHEERAPAIFPPAVLIFGLPTQKIC